MDAGHSDTRIRRRIDRAALQLRTWIAILCCRACRPNVAEKVELELAKAGMPVISNASSHRMKADVPLLIPEINPDHLDALTVQKQRMGGKGFIVTNPNCTTIGLVFPLAALHRKFGVEAVSVVTMQALSGAGYPGVASLDIIDNVLPAIDRGRRRPEDRDRAVEAAGPMEEQRLCRCAHSHERADPSRECSRRASRSGIGKTADRRPRATKPKRRSAISVPRSTNSQLPSAPRPAIIVESDIQRPQPRLDRDRGNGMAVVVGPVQPCAVLDYKFRLCSHNTIRGAAGAAILNAELLYKKGMLG